MGWGGGRRWVTFLLPSDPSSYSCTVCLTFVFSPPSSPVQSSSFRPHLKPVIIHGHILVPLSFVLFFFCLIFPLIFFSIYDLSAHLFCSSVILSIYFCIVLKYPNMYYPNNIAKLSQNYPKIIPQISENYPKIVPKLYKKSQHFSKIIITLFLIFF